MKLSKKNEAVQRTIHRAVASGKALGGLIVGLAATVAGCRERTPADTMGSYPASPQLQEEIAMRNRRVVPGEPPVPQLAETNAVNECTKRKANPKLLGVPMPVKDRPK